MFKKGDFLGENVLMIYRLLMLSVIVFIILGISSTVYAYDIAVSDAEAALIGRQLQHCVLDSSRFSSFDLSDDSTRYGVLDACSFSGDLSRVYANVTFYDSEGSSFLVLEQGDSGALWIQEFWNRPYYDRARISTSFGSFGDYRPGYFSQKIPISYPLDDSVVSGFVSVEVFVHARS